MSTKENYPATAEDEQSIRPEESREKATDGFELSEQMMADVDEADFIPSDSEEDTEAAIFEVDYEKIQQQEEREEAFWRRLRKMKLSRLSWTLIACAVAMFVIMGAFYIFRAKATTKKLERIYLKEELSGYAMSTASAFAAYVHGDFSFEDGVLKKGDTTLEAMYEYLDEFGRKTDTVLRVYFGTECVMTTEVGEDGKRASAALDNAVYDEVRKSNYYFQPDKNENGRKVSFYCYPLMQESTGETIGAVYCEKVQNGGNETMKKASLDMILGGTVLGLLCVLGCAAVILNIMTAIRKAVDNLQEITEGNLVVKFSDRVKKRNDEVGSIVRAIDSLVERLNGTADGLTASSGALNEFSELLHESMTKISGTVEGVNIAIEDIAKGATSQAGETMQANNRVAEIGAVIECTAAEVEQLSDSARKMDEISINADTTLQELLLISKEADDAVIEIRHQTDRTNKSVQQIQRATDMITEIASQTNLLSLNASIEAARAGEAGQGFAVVADEIRQLAEQSKASAEEIRDIVEELINNSDNSVKKMNGVSESINTQNDKLDETLKVFGELSAEISAVMKAIKEIAKQTKELSRTRESVVGIVEDLAAIAQENAASAEETSASMYEVGSIVEECRTRTEELNALKEELARRAKSFRKE